MENIILDPSNWKDNGFIYKDSVDKLTRGSPLISKGFFNMKCNNNPKLPMVKCIINIFVHGIMNIMKKKI